MASSDPASILIVGPAWIGDMVMAQSLFKVLKQRNPHVRLDVLASPWTLPLLARMPEVDNTIEMPLGHGALDFGTRRKLGEFLSGIGYEQAIILPNSFKSALVPAFAGIPERTGWRGEMRYFLINDIRLLSKRRYPKMVQRYLALAYPPDAVLPENYPRPALRVDPLAVPQLLTKFALSDQRPVLILCPGAEFGPSKRWPEAYFAQVAAEKIAEGWQVWLMGSAKDQPVAQSICDQVPQTSRDQCFNLAGVTRLDEAIDLMSTASAVVSNDSGLMHIAAALGRPLVVLYGSTSPDFTPPLSDDVMILSNKIECAPCFKRECPKVHHKCLKDLMPQQVLAALNALDDRPRP